MAGKIFSKNNITTRVGAKDCLAKVAYLNFPNLNFVFSKKCLPKFKLIFFLSKDVGKSRKTIVFAPTLVRILYLATPFPGLINPKK